LKRSWTYALIVLTLVAGAAFVACGGGSDNKSNNSAPTAVQNQGGDQGGNQATPTTGAKATAKSGNSGSSSGSIGDIPVYTGAKKDSSGSYSGSNAMIPMIGSSVNASDYGTVQYGIYETSDSAQDVYNWYKDKMSGWKEEWSYSGGSQGSTGAMAVWTKDNPKVAAWLIVGEDNGTTTLSIWYGSS
jgi:hypothetical protein